MVKKVYDTTKRKVYDVTKENDRKNVVEISLPKEENNVVDLSEDIENVQDYEEVGDFKEYHELEEYNEDDEEINEDEDYDETNNEEESVDLSMVVPLITGAISIGVVLTIGYLVISQIRDTLELSTNSTSIQALNVSTDMFSTMIMFGVVIGIALFVRRFIYLFRVE